MRRSSDPPIVLVKWYDATKWILERVDSFPKNQRFISLFSTKPMSWNDLPEGVLEYWGLRIFRLTRPWPDS
jgi:hypothetical protein